MIITFCGHSDYTETKEDERKILSVLTEKIGNNRAELYLGGYGSFDLFARKCGKIYQKTHPNTRLILITPYLSASYQKNHLDAQRDLYDEIIYPELENVPPKLAILRCNQWMVERADLVISYIVRTFGGAYQTYRYAKRKEKILFNLTEKESKC